MANLDPGQLSRELSHQIHTGSRQFVADRLAELPPSLAASVAFYLRDQIEGDAYLIGVMGRFLERKAIEDQEAI